MYKNEPVSPKYLNLGSQNFGNWFVDIDSQERMSA